MGYLSEVARRRIAAGLLALGALVVVLALTDKGPFSDPPTEEEKVVSVIEDFYGAASGGDFKTYCALLTKAGPDRIQANAARLIGNTDVGGCQGILEKFGKPLEDGMLRIAPGQRLGQPGPGPGQLPDRDDEGPAAPHGPARARTAKPAGGSTTLA